MSNRWEESNGHYERSSSRMASLDEYARASTPSATAEGRIAGGMDVDTSKGLPVGIPSFSRTTRGGGENSLAYGHGGGYGESGESKVPHATTKLQTTAPAMSYPFLCREDVGVGVSVGDTYKDAQDTQAFVAPAPFDWQPSMPFAPDENVLDDDGMRMHRSSRGGGSDSLYTSGGGGGGMSANPYDLPSQRGGSSMSSSPYYQAPGMYSTQMVLPSSLSRLRSNQGVPGASKLLPREGRAAPPPPNPLEPSMPPVVFNRRFLKNNHSRRLPDLCEGKVAEAGRGSPVQIRDDEHVATCRECHSSLLVKKSAILVKCPICTKVHPTVSSTINNGRP